MHRTQQRPLRFFSFGDCWFAIESNRNALNCFIDVDIRKGKGLTCVGRRLAARFVLFLGIVAHCHGTFGSSVVDCCFYALY